MPTLNEAYPLPTIPGARRTEHVGSRVTCRPVPAGTDDDWLALVTDTDAAARFFAATGWRQGGGAPADGDSVSVRDRFWSFAKGELNVIITQSEHFFDQFMLATRVAKKLNLLHKIHRIDLFQAILYGNCP
jgi:hypothetical protein